MGKALGNIDFLRFFNKKINNFPTKIDMDLNFFQNLLKWGIIRDGLLFEDGVLFE